MKLLSSENSILVERGQSLLELIIAVGIFAIVVSVLAFLTIGSYAPGRLAQEITEAVFMTEEGIEAVRSIRDSSWDALTEGPHGLAISGNNWIFQGIQEDVSWQLNDGQRIIYVESLGPDRKKITSQVIWKFTETRPQKVELTTYLTNWQKITIFCQGTCSPCSSFVDRGLCMGQSGCSWLPPQKVCSGICTGCETFFLRASCEAQSGCFWTGP